MSEEHPLNLFFNISETNHPKLVVSGIPYTFLALGSARFSGPHEGSPRWCAVADGETSRQHSPRGDLFDAHLLKSWDFPTGCEFGKELSDLHKFPLISHSQLCRSVSVSSLNIRWLEMIEGIYGGTITLFHTVEMTLDTVIISKEYGDGS